jgi:hypothetical protein
LQSGGYYLFIKSKWHAEPDLGKDISSWALPRTVPVTFPTITKRYDSQKRILCKIVAPCCVFSTGQVAVSLDEIGNEKAAANTIFTV